MIKFVYLPSLLDLRRPIFAVISAVSTEYCCSYDCISVAIVISFYNSTRFTLVSIAFFQKTDKNETTQLITRPKIGNCDVLAFR